MLPWLPKLFSSALARFGLGPKAIPDALWQQTLTNYPFLARLPANDRLRLRELTGRFLAHKEFTGAHGLVVTDEMAVAIAAQACLPVLNFGKKGLRLYDDFKGIVVHPGAMLARREMRDAAGVVHYYSEALSGEAMQGGPVTLSWQDVAASGALAELGHNVVIHEFVHKIDMREGFANGCPPLPSRTARAAWLAVMKPAFENFRRQVVMAERFAGLGGTGITGVTDETDGTGVAAPWLNAYGATSPAEFFAVASEAYFVNRARFEHDFADLTQLFDAFFRPNSLPAQQIRA